MVSDHRRPLVIFSLVVLYVIFQFAWWAYLLLEQNSSVTYLQHELLKAGVIEPDQIVSYSPWMVIGEAAVFVLLLALGVWLTYRTLRRELSLATVQHDMLLAITHELRTPIAAMRLNLQTMQRKDVPAEQRDVLLEQAIADTTRLQLLSDKVLLATQLEEKALFLDSKVRNVSELLNSLIDRAESTYAAQHEIKRAIQADLNWPMDELAFRSISDNLVENACKYAPTNTTISVMLKKEGRSLCFRVEDEGQGVPETDRPFIFDKFHRASGHGHQAKGSGLGLYIVASLVRLLNGRIQYRPGNPQGSIFEAEFHPAK